MTFPMSVDFSVKFQWDVGTNVYNEPTTVAELDDLVCNIDVSEAANIPTAAGFTSVGTTEISSVVGVGFSGVTFYGAVSADSVDPLYPAVYADVTDTSSAEEMFDMCLGHPQDTGMYHYHAFAPCVLDSSYSTTPTGCNAITECADDVLTYGEDAYASYKTTTPIGISKDGHIIYGPYKSDGTLVAYCDVDVCNGAWINGYYGYYATYFHPYFLGCFGPGSNSTLS
jgi:hypothetical protein